MPQPRKLHDEYFLRAKQEGYAARSAYKLMEIDQKRRLIFPGDAVLDLGCAPGSWLQVASELVGPEGRVRGIDLQRVTIPLPPHVRTSVADVFAAPPGELLEGIAPGRFQVVLSDMAPSTTGHGDDLLSARLCRAVLALLPDVLATGGRLCMKVLEGSETPELIRETRELFAHAGTTKPKASRDVSREIFIVGHSYLGRAPHTPPPEGVAPRPPAPGKGWGRLSP